MTRRESVIHHQAGCKEPAEALYLQKGGETMPWELGCSKALGGCNAWTQISNETRASLKDVRVQGAVKDDPRP
jgi:hypothetical protein